MVCQLTLLEKSDFITFLDSRVSSYDGVHAVWSAPATGIWLFN